MGGGKSSVRLSAYLATRNAFATKGPSTIGGRRNELRPAPDRFPLTRTFIHQLWDDLELIHTLIRSKASTLLTADFDRNARGRTPANPPGDGLITDVPLTIDPFIPTIVSTVAPEAINDSTRITVGAEQAYRRPPAAQSPRATR